MEFYICIMEKYLSLEKIKVFRLGIFGVLFFEKKFV